MVYCTRTDIEAIYGKANVAKWADLNSTNNQQEIAARIQLMCEVATGKINNKLRGGPYAIPFVVIDATIVDLTARYAAYLLYMGRPVDDEDETTHPVKSVKKDIEKELRDIRIGRTRLGVVSNVTWAPAIVDD